MLSDPGRRKIGREKEKAGKVEKRGGKHPEKKGGKNKIQQIFRGGAHSIKKKESLRTSERYQV